MSSIYVQLALLVVIFASFGFLLHAFYFGDSRQRRLSKELEELRKELEEKERGLREAEDATQKSEKVIQSLEKQLKQKAAEMDHLKHLAARQDKAIEMLQKDAEAIRAAVSGSAKSVRPVEEALSAVVPDRVDHKAKPSEHSAPPRESQGEPHREQPPAAALPGQQGTPAWRANLDNILSMLESMEKEVDK